VIIINENNISNDLWFTLKYLEVSDFQKPFNIELNFLSTYEVRNIDIQLIIHTKHKESFLWKPLTLIKSKNDTYTCNISSAKLRTVKDAKLEQATLVELRVKKKKDYIGNHALSLLKLKKFEDSKIQFYKLLNKLNLNANIKNNWKETYNSLILINQNFLESTDINITEDNKSNKGKSKKVNKILVSGMGWSGSGALYDFFLEFENTKETIKEFQFIEGTKGLFNVYKKIKLKQLTIEDINELFWYAIFGNIVGYTYPEIRLTNSAKQFTLGEKAESYSIACKNFFDKLEKNIHKLNIDIFHNITKDFINAIFIEYTNLSNNSEYILLDNVIHAERINAVELLDDYKIFVTFRDPRSNYVAHFNENPRFNPDVDLYIKDYKTKREQFQKSLSNTKDKNNIHIVQFEDFVLSQSYRDNIIEKSNLDPNRRIEFSRFKPWESEKNVFLHETFENQDIINKITKELQEYCIDKRTINKEN